MLDKIEIIRQVEKKIKKGDYKGALGDVTRCLELYPNFLVAKVLKAECLLNLNNSEEALALANEVLFTAPDNIKARKIAVEANLQLGNIDEAKSHIDFLGFLLPANHAYLDEIKKRVIEQENLHELSGEQEDFEIERTSFEEKESTVYQQADEKTTEGKNVITPRENPVEIEKSIEEKTDEILEEKEAEQEDFLINSEELKEVKEEVEYKDEDNIDVEEIAKEEMVTGVLQEQISTVTLPEKREEPEIKTRTLALIYERQGMFQEALEILENLFDESQDVELLKDIERVKTKLKGGQESDFIVKKIKVLENWLERVKWHSSN